MRHRLATLVCLVLTTGCASARKSGEESEVVETVLAFFDVIASRDADAGRALMVPDGVFVNVRTTDGSRELRHFSNATWLEGLPAGTTAMKEAFEGEPTVLVDGDVAVVWGRYVFDIDGERSHTGVDAFNLVRTDEGWKIAGGSYSVVR